MNGEIESAIRAEFPDAESIIVDRVDGELNAILGYGPIYRASFKLNGIEYRAKFDQNGQSLPI